MMVMYGGLAGSFWWVMLTFTVFQFIVIQLSSDGVKKAVRLSFLKMDNNSYQFYYL
jgi:hypothetical protein